jgi:hypothetical protein
MRQGTVVHLSIYSAVYIFATCICDTCAHISAYLSPHMQPIHVACTIPRTHPLCFTILIASYVPRHSNYTTSPSTKHVHTYTNLSYRLIRTQVLFVHFALDQMPYHSQFTLPIHHLSHIISAMCPYRCAASTRLAKLGSESDSKRLLASSFRIRLQPLNRRTKTEQRGATQSNAEQHRVT